MKTGEKIITPPEMSVTDVAIFDPGTTFGVKIVGDAQAGKTTLRRFITDSWATFDPEGGVLAFSNSNGFRGLTACILEYAHQDLESPVPSDGRTQYDVYPYSEMLADFLADHTIEEVHELLDELYVSPRDEQTVLRSPGVNSVVDVTSEHQTLRPAVNEAGARYLKRVIDDPGLMGLDEKPGLVVLDARNKDECHEKFVRAGVRDLGTFVLSCPELVVAERIVKKKYGTDATDEHIMAEMYALQSRNARDRNRSLGRMTVAVDLTERHWLDDILKLKRQEAIISVGMALANDHGAGLVIRTDKVSEAEEKMAVDLILHGMLVASERSTAVVQ